MNEIIKWIKDNLGEDVKIVTPQFERSEKLEFDYIPRTEEEFMTVVKIAPWSILKGMGFRKWDKMSNVRRENSTKPVNDIIQIPILNAPGETFSVNCGRMGRPTEQPLIDEDIILIPGEWYNIIPNGFIVTGLWGEQYAFKRGESDDDIRFGCLPYGITRPIKDNETLKPVRE